LVDGLSEIFGYPDRVHPQMKKCAQSASKKPRNYATAIAYNPDPDKE